MMSIGTLISEYEWVAEWVEEWVVLNTNYVLKNMRLYSLTNWHTRSLSELDMREFENWKIISLKTSLLALLSYFVGVSCTLVIRARCEVWMVRNMHLTLYIYMYIPLYVIITIW